MNMDGTLRMIAILYSSCLILFSFVNHIAHSLDAIPPTPSNSCNADDKRVLLQIKDHFHNAYPFSQWTSESNDCCNWPGVTCHDDLPGRIDGLVLYEATHVSGEVPAIVADLPFLRTLAFDTMPNLSGPLPPSLTKLTRLAEISIYLTNMSGPIPDFLSQIKSLRALQLINNQFSGSIPSSLSLLPNLFILNLGGNKLRGAIPESFGSFKTNLTLKLNGNNELSGEIPKSLGEVNITTLDLSYNQFVGDASFLLGKDKPLQEVTLRQNRLKFNFSNVELPLGLNYFDIAYNEIYGSLPRSLGQHQWFYFNVSNNQLCGKIPKGRRLKQFSPSRFAHNKCLCGAPGLPACK